MPIRTNLHSVVLGAVIAGLLATSMAQFGIGRDAALIGPNLLVAAYTAAAYAAVFLTAHLTARRFRLDSAAVYAALGALAGGTATWLGFTVTPGDADPVRALEPAILAATFCTATGALYRLHATYADRDWREALAAD